MKGSHRHTIRTINGGLWLLLLLPLALLSWRQLTLPAGEAWRPWVDGRNARQIENVYDQQFVLRDWSTNAWAAMDFKLFNEGRPGVVVGRQGWLFTREEMTWSADSSRFLSANLDEMAAVARQLQQANIQLVPVLIPAKSDIYADQVIGANPQQQAELYDLALHGLQQRGIQVTDLRPALRQARQQQPVFLHTDTHWTPFGAAQVAQAIAASLGEQDSAHRFKTTAGQPQVYRGDLLNYIPVSPHFDSWGPAADQLVVPVTEDSAATDLLATPAPVTRALVGTSYSANERWNFAGALRQATGQDLNNYAVEGKGPFVPMRDWLSSTDLAKSGLRSVIWDIPVRYLVQSFPRSTHK